MSKLKKLPLHLVIEGADKVGKSTVCKLLSEKLKMPVIKMKDMPLYFRSGNAEEASEVFNKTVTQFKDFSFILDRFYPSSLVYSEYFNRVSADLTYIKDIQKELQPLIIVLYSNKPRSEDDLHKEFHITELTMVYKKYAKNRKWWILNVDGLTPEETCKKILLKIKNVGSN